jgi:hypothetical protein
MDQSCCRMWASLVLGHTLPCEEKNKVKLFLLYIILMGGWLAGWYACIKGLSRVVFFNVYSSIRLVSVGS